MNLDEGVVLRYNKNFGWRPSFGRQADQGDIL